MKYQEKHLSKSLLKDKGMTDKELQEMRELGVDEENLEALSPQGRVEMKQRILYYANLINPIMQTILDHELKLGNRISDASCDYPDQGSIHVTLAKSFLGKYKIENVIYHKGNDPHYWSEDYMSETEPRHLILC